MLATTKFKGIQLTLNGVEYVVPPLNFRVLQELQDRLEAFTGGTDTASLGLVVDCLHGALLRNYPGITREETVDMLDLENMEQVMQAVMDVSGMNRKKVAEQLAAEGTPNPSTGLSSTPA